MKLFVADNHDRAEMLANKLGLDRSVWFVCGIGRNLIGRRFEDMVDVSVPSGSETERNQQYNWLRYASSKVVRT